MAYTNKFRGVVLWKDPYIIYTGSYKNSESPNVFEELLHKLRDNDVIILQLVAWCHENSKNALDLVLWSKSVISSKKHRIIFMANTHKEAEEIRMAGGESLFLHQNALVDSNLFSVEPVERFHPAVYNAQFLSFKRHVLTKEIKSPAFVSYHLSRDYYDEVICTLNNDYFLYNKFNDYRLSWIGYSKLNEIYNSSHCGLCLSAEEGGMHASVEYLLAGLPLVTTFSRGGRDYFFDEFNSIYVKDEAHDVATAVDYWVKNSNYERRREIRKKTIELQLKELVKYKLLLKVLISEKYANVDVNKLWDKIFTDKLILLGTLDELFERFSTLSVDL